MLRKLACLSSRHSAAAAVTVTFVGSRWLTLLPPIEGRASTSTPLRSAMRLALCTPRRSAATSRAAGTAQQSDDASSGPTPTEAEIIAAADWKSPQYEERLGFHGGDAITEERLKRHYYVLAKHFHPDAAAGGAATAQSTEAFHSVKEAYDAISATLKEGSAESFGGGASADGSGDQQDFAGGFTYSDEARRRSQMRLLGETVMLFVAMSVLLIYVVSRHNKNRMHSRYLWHLVWIFFMIQLFPRLLAAAIIFAAHSMYLLDNTTLKEQAAVSLVVERRKTECTVKLDGIRAEAVPHVVVQVTTTSAVANDAAEAGQKEQVSSTLTFDKGVTEFLLPAPVHPHSVYHIKAVDEERKLVLVDRIISASL
ncbi:heat shock protein [Lotmaria passim]